MREKKSADIRILVYPSRQPETRKLEVFAKKVTKFAREWFRDAYVDVETTQRLVTYTTRRAAKKGRK